MTLHLAMELKKDGQRIFYTLVQLCESLEESVDKKGNTEKDTICDRQAFNAFEGKIRSVI